MSQPFAAARRAVGMVINGGSSVEHRSILEGHREAKGQPFTGRLGSGGWPSIVTSRSWRTSIRGSDLCKATVYGWDALVNTSAVVEDSTIRPAYMTITRWVTPATTPRSWVISSGGSSGG